MPTIKIYGLPSVKVGALVEEATAIDREMLRRAIKRDIIREVPELMLGRGEKDIYVRFMKEEVPEGDKFIAVDVELFDRPERTPAVLKKLVFEIACTITRMYTEFEVEVGPVNVVNEEIGSVCRRGRDYKP